MNHQYSEHMLHQEISQRLLEWYQVSGRELPWRVKGGAHPDPYIVLVSEFMLQQTGVKTVIPYFHKFLERFPTLQDLAQASLDEVLLYWQGLGYYTRARSLHASAQKIMNYYQGCFPQTRKEILQLSGIGPYTASSLMALAFNLPETVIDGNVIRVICRMYHLTAPVSELTDIIREKATALTDKSHAADYASAIMDLGALICTPKNPRCLLCPWHKYCLSSNDPQLEQIPSLAKPQKEIRRGAVFLITNHKQEIFIRQRTEKGLLSGLYELPWYTQEIPPYFTKAVDSGATVTHIFTHIKLTLQIFTLRAETIPLDGQFVTPMDLNKYPLSTLMKKIFTKIKPK